MKIEIDDEVKVFLDKWLYGEGAEAWYCGGVKLDLQDYNGAIKSIVNRLDFWKALSENSIAPHNTFDSEIRVIVQEKLR